VLGDHVFEFGEFRFDADAPLLTHSSRSIEIEPRALQVLAVLVKNAGQVVSRDDLLNLVWPGTVVEDGNLTVHISCLRKAFGGNRGGDAYIETISKRGYRFAAPVRQIQPAKPRADRELNRICQLANRYLEQQTPDGCLHAAALFRECLESDPSSIPARVGLAYALLWQYLLGAAPRSETVPTAVTLLSETNEIDRRSAQAQVGLAFCAAGSEWQWQIAEEHSWHAVELSSEGEQDYMTRTWLGGYLVRRGNVELGLGQLRLPVHDPLCPVVWSGLADAYYLARDFPASTTVL
jgi:DNA-binding winged helix-turn-helix (wHTH) protein